MPPRPRRESLSLLLGPVQVDRASPLNPVSWPPCRQSNSFLSRARARTAPSLSSPCSTLKDAGSPSVLERRERMGSRKQGLPASQGGPAALPDGRVGRASTRSPCVSARGSRGTSTSSTSPASPSTRSMTTPLPPPPTPPPRTHAPRSFLCCLCRSPFQSGAPAPPSLRRSLPAACHAPAVITSRGAWGSSGRPSVEVCRPHLTAPNTASRPSTAESPRMPVPLHPN